MQKQRREQSRNNSAAMGQGPGSSARNIHNNIFEFFCRTKAPTLVEDGNFRLRARSLGHLPVTSPPTNQKKVTHPAALTPNFAYKNFPPKPLGRTSLAVQRLRLCAFIARGMGSIPGWGTKISHAAPPGQKKKKKLGSSGFLSSSHLFSLLGPARNLSLLQTPVRENTD